MSIKSKCKVNTDGSVCLEEILDSFNAPISEERAWALCYQCAKFFLETLNVNRSDCYIVVDVNELYLQTDGNVHPATLFGRGIAEEDVKRRHVQNDIDLINCLGLVTYNALDRGNDHNEERPISKDLEDLISDMIRDEHSGIHETDDEGIEKDSEVFDESSSSNFTAGITLQEILQKCEKHLATLSKSQAEIHYKAVVRAFVAEAIELATFLERVSQKGATKLHGVVNQDLEQLQFADWTRYWLQVIAELRLGVKLKKVNYTRAPIEYELTPYEILMKDIRSCRYSLRKIMVDGNPPSRVSKDAHALILEFIKSRPPLKKASERKLAPYSRKLTPREQLMNSIRNGRTLKKTQTNTRYSLSPKRETNEFTEGEHKKRLIKVDFSQILDDDEDDAQSDSSESANGLWAQEECREVYGTALEAYDLALDCPETRLNTRRDTLTVLQSSMGSHSVPQSRPCSRQSCESSDNESIHLAPDIAKALENPSKPWHESMPLDDLTLEEIVHIRTVLTKAELEALPVEGHVKSDAENRKVCFLCLKTRFGILGPWGNKCTICKRTVCSKCCSKMNIPMEHFSSVPVVLLSPSIMATPVDDNFPISKFAQQDSIYSNSTSNQSSPISNRSPAIEAAKKLRTKPSPSNSCSSNSSIPCSSKSVVDKLKGSQMIVCQDCKMMVLQIIKSAQVNRAAIRNKTIQNLTLNISPVF